MLCRKLNLLSDTLAVDGSKFKAVNNRDKNFTKAKMKRRIVEVEASIERYLEQLNDADHAAPAEDQQPITIIADQGYYRGEELLACEKAGITAYVAKADTSGKRGKGEFSRRQFRYIPEDDEYECPAGERAIYRFTRTEAGKQIRRYWSSACAGCPIKSKCTPADYRRISRWEHEAVVERAESRLAEFPEAMRVRRATVEHPLGTLKQWMGSTFLTRQIGNVSTEMSLHVLAYNMKRAMKLVGAKALMEAI